MLICREHVIHSGLQLTLQNEHPRVLPALLVPYFGTSRLSTNYRDIRTRASLGIVFMAPLGRVHSHHSPVKILFPSSDFQSAAFSPAIFLFSFCPLFPFLFALLHYRTMRSFRSLSLARAASSI